MSLSEMFLDEEDRPKEGVLLIDLSQLAIATATHTYQNGEKINTSMVRTLLLSTMKYNVLKAKREGYTKIIIAVDNASKGYWRRQEAWYYKKNRAAAREESKFDWEGFFEGLKVVKAEFAKHMPYFLIDVDFAEADDIIAVLTKYFSLKGHKVRIISSDGDFTQLHKYPNVTQWSPMQKKFVKSKSGSPAVDCMIKIVKGDRKDGVSGIKVRNDFYHTMVEGERTPPTKASFIEELVDAGSDEAIEKLLTPEQWVRFKENRVLIDFDYIREDMIASIMQCYNDYIPAKRKEMYSYFVKTGQSTLLTVINEF